MEPNEFKALVGIADSPLELLAEYIPKGFKLRHKEYSNSFFSGPCEVNECAYFNHSEDVFGFKPIYELDFKWNFDLKNNDDSTKMIVNFLNQEKVKYFVLIENDESTKGYLACGFNGERFICDEFKL